MTLALAQLFHLGNAQSTEPMLRPEQIVSNRFALAGNRGIPDPSAGRHLRGAAGGDPPGDPLGPADWLVVLTCAAIPGVVGQAIRQRRARRMRRH